MPNIKPILFNGDMVRALLDNRKTVTRRVVNPQPRMVYYDGKLQDSGEDLLNGKPLEVLIAENQNGGVEQIVPPYQPSSIMYVQETWCKTDCFGLQNGYVYKANDNSILEQTGFVPKWRSPVCMPREAARLFLRVTNMSVAKLQDITVDDILREGIQDIEPPPICQKEPHYPESFPRGFDKWDKAKQDDWIKSEARARYIGWCEYADNLRRGFSKIWNACYEKPRPVKGKNGLIDHYESYPWEDSCETRTYRGKPWYVIGNPWVWVIEFERISKEEAYGECK